MSLSIQSQSDALLARVQGAQVKMSKLSPHHALMKRQRLLRALRRRKYTPPCIKTTGSGSREDTASASIVMPCRGMTACYVHVVYALSAPREDE